MTGTTFSVTFSFVDLQVADVEENGQAHALYIGYNIHHEIDLHPSSRENSCWENKNKIKNSRRGTLKKKGRKFQ